MDANDMLKELIQNKINESYELDNETTNELKETILNKMEEKNRLIDPTEDVKDDGVIMIPVHIMSVCGDQNTPADKRLSYSQVAFVTPEQFQIINLRLNDMAQTINSFIEENRKNEGM